MLPGSHKGVIAENVKELKRKGHSEASAVKHAAKHAGGERTIEPKKAGQKKIKFHEGGLHSSTGTKPGEKISASKHAAARSGKLGPKAKEQEVFYENVLKK